MKLCCACSKILDLCEFSLVKKNGKINYHSRCKKCRREYDREWYKNNIGIGDRIIKKRNNTKNRIIKIKTYVWDYLREHPCVDCGISNPIILEFDHVRGEKIFSISDGISLGYSLDKIITEIQKCDIRCCNCHRLKTHLSLGWNMY